MTLGEGSRTDKVTDGWNRKCCRNSSLCQAATAPETQESRFGLPKGKVRDGGMSEEPGSTDMPYSC